MFTSTHAEKVTRKVTRATAGIFMKTAEWVWEAGSARHGTERELGSAKKRATGASRGPKTIIQ